MKKNEDEGSNMHTKIIVKLSLLQMRMHPNKATTHSQKEGGKVTL